jgi:hypothetical protein
VSLELDYLERKHRDLREREGVRLDRASFAHWVAWGHLRRGRRLRAALVYLRSGLRNARIRDVALAIVFGLRAMIPVPNVRLALQALRGGRKAQPVQLVEPAWLRLYR